MPEAFRAGKAKTLIPDNFLPLTEVTFPETVVWPKTFPCSNRIPNKMLKKILYEFTDIVGLTNIFQCNCFAILICLKHVLWLRHYSTVSCLPVVFCCT